jgi:hypothetical protein
LHCPAGALSVHEILEMIMAFMLLVMVNGEMRDTEMMYFKNINRCNFFANAIETGYKNDKQYKITAWCEPKMVPEATKFWD